MAPRRQVKTKDQLPTVQVDEVEPTTITFIPVWSRGDEDVDTFSISAERTIVKKVLDDAVQGSGFAFLDGCWFNLRNYRAFRID